MTETALVKGNEAIAMGAIEAGCRFYFGYPITPQNDIPEYMAKHLPDVGGTFIQAESEIASINMLLGAGAAGARAMTSSSSPGISLKQEGISYLPNSRCNCQHEQKWAWSWRNFPFSGGLFSGNPGRWSR